MATDTPSAMLDPRLLGEPVTTTLPTRRHDDDPDSEGEGSVGKRRKNVKQNLWKCKPCRDARKKCFPENRIWPQKCERCLQHRPEALECSEPQLNTRKRGKNLSKQNQQPTRRQSQSRSQSERPESRGRESSDDSESDGVPAQYDRPVRTTVVKNIKEEFPDSRLIPKIVQPIQPSPIREQRPASAYIPLKDGEFRILQLNPGRKEDKAVVCSFKTASIAEPVEYEAISYLWGGSDAKQQTSVDISLRDANGIVHPLKIRSNLHSALRNLRHPKDPKLFWVDALCINRSNGTEMNKQVAMKRDIFHKAANLCFWLGEDASYKTALNFIPQILDLTKVDELVKDDGAIDGWVAFVTLLKNVVFSRLWLVQEVAVARNVTLHSGQPAIHYGDFVDAVAMFVSFRADLILLFRRHKKKHEATERPEDNNG
ncbi:Heterokaryon incompatibility protein 6 OR allele [Lachnellula suecica]|uniref:Heterokaryon incompatibility protein 6 OR allele n=1 Tax=Lachnellula suecica TaxID=602035 RepID=A0A8T9BTT3_9HELO|nr:Heterokaryon incompatibility protein 6 OR allele [Lachnellula suecica]